MGIGLLSQIFGKAKASSKYADEIEQAESCLTDGLYEMAIEHYEKAFDEKITNGW